MMLFGMIGKVLFEIDLVDLLKIVLVNDIVYVLLEMDLLKQVVVWGNLIVDGFGMLLYQVVLGFECWFGVWLDVDDVFCVLVLKDFGVGL